MKKYSGELTPKAFKEHIKPIVNNPLNAIIELIANSHDAGATRLDINWPSNDTLYETDNKTKLVIFKDNGCGMSKEEFTDIWGQLSYNRIDSQGKYVEVITEEGISKRQVYGRNGKGRHSPFAFSNHYDVKTIRNNELSHFSVQLDDKSFKFNLVESKKVDADNGTEISFNIGNKINSIDEVKESIATRFLKDDSFSIYVNGEKVDLMDINKENINEFNCEFEDNIIKITQLKSSNTSTYKKFHGVSWKIGTRLIEDKTWDNILDGRRRVSKQFNFIIDGEILEDYVNETMTSFIKDDYVSKVKNAVYDSIKKSLSNARKKENDATKKNIIEDNIVGIKKIIFIK